VTGRPIPWGIPQPIGGSDRHTNSSLAILQDMNEETGPEQPLTLTKTITASTNHPNNRELGKAMIRTNCLSEHRVP
jgi:hypothetical protein